MFKSFSDSIRSLWKSRAPETVQIPDRKRKRSSAEIDEDDSDVEIVSVKRPKQGDRNSSPGFLSFLTFPMSKMSAWVRKKTVRQDHLFTRPIPLTPRTSRVADEQHALLGASSDHNATNGTFHYHRQSTERLSRPSIHHRNGTHENGVNGDIYVVDKQPSLCSFSTTSSRRSSCSSTRPGIARPSTVDQCFQLKEKENYLKLLQQHTTVDLGYHDNKPKANSSCSASTHFRHSQSRKSGDFLPVPSSSSAPSSSLSRSFVSFRSDSHPRAAHVRVMPSRFAMTPVLPSDRVAENRVSRKESFARPRPPGQVQQVHSTGSVSQKTHQHSSHPESKQKEKAVPSSQADPEVLIIEDNFKSFRSSRHPISLDFKSSEFLDDDWITKLNSKYASAERERRRLIEEAEQKKKLLEERRQGRLENIDKTLHQQLKLFEEEPEVTKELPLSVLVDKPLPELTEAMQREINAALSEGPSSEVLSEGFRLQLTRADIATLRGLNWLNDEVINFYMNMLMARGQQEGFSKTHAFNTFFYPKLLSGGQSALKRWTRKVDIFSHEYVVIPVHLGVHWCLCVIFMKEKKICYYDSMGGNNNQCLNAVRQYIYDESLEKRNIKLDLSEWSTEIVKDMPQQMNGSDCGMFTCMIAETITRGAKITFTQKDMPYFRRRMVYEILTKQLL